MEIKRTLTATEMNALYNTMIVCLYDEEDEYLYQFRDYLWRRAVIESYTDLSLPSDTDEAYEICRNEKIWNEIQFAVDVDQLDEINNAVRDYVADKERRKQAGWYFHELMKDMQGILDVFGQLTSGDFDIESMAKKG